MSLYSRVVSKLTDFCVEEDGVGSVYGVFAVVLTMGIGGYAVDVANVMTSRTDLQIAADSVAHAALLKRELGTASAARAAALNVSTANLSVAEVGQIIHSSDIVFGDWDPDTRTFTARESSRSAVQVTARQNAANGNPIATFMLRIVNFEQWNLDVKSTFTTYRPTCLREGFVAEDMVDLQSNNTYTNGFCIHSNEYVSLNSNNTFEPGTIVSMASLDDLELPNSGYRTNIGLSEALREGSWNIRILKRIDDIIAGVTNPSSPFYPSYITHSTPVTLTTRTVRQSDLAPGRIYTASCSGGASLTIDNNVQVDKIVLVTSCKIKFNQGVVLTDTVIATTDTSSKSMTSPSGLQVGKDDNCALGGEAQLVTAGSMEFPADLRIYGGQLLAKQDISFAANANGIQGAQMVAGGIISGTSNMNMGFCGNQETANFQVDYFKLVE